MSTRGVPFEYSKRIFQWLCASSVWLFVGHAAAQEAPSSPASDVRVRLRAEKPGTKLEVWSSGRLLDSCGHGCELELPPGYYTLRAKSGRDLDDYELPVRGATTVHLHEGNGLARGAGLVTAMVGLAAFGGSFILMATHPTKPDCNGLLWCTTSDNARVAFVVGLVLVPTGFILFGTNRDHLKVVADGAPQRRAHLTAPRVGLVGLAGGGFGLGGGVQF